ncbi:collagenase [Streptomyces sp. HB2AG]|uniref:collagenase n=1 Tax=Streptomyces sp. HB2AG TaxID=2983400 RepID=UPI0022AB3BEF|nr:collagenase [Streptomyces sp. HB2AG]MCZ2524196.1 collagenase [Streptomyces sp. HB2AG]
MKKSLVRRSLGAALPLALTLAMGSGLLAQPAGAQTRTSVSAVSAAQAAAGGGKQSGPPPAAQSVTADVEHVGKGRLKASELPPLAASKDALKKAYGQPEKQPLRPSESAKKADRGKAGKTAVTAAAACNVSDFTGRTGSALVQQIKASTTDCVNTLFNLTGNDAYNAFRESQMTSVAYALRDGSASYPGDSTTGMPQLVLYLRAGYYVHYYNPDAVGPYGSSLRTAIRSGLDAFFASPRSRDVSDANGETLAEAVTLIDSSEENARYIYVLKRLLADYDSSWNSSWWMLNAANNVYVVTFRGHQVPAFVTAVQSDPSLIDALYNFASGHLALLGTDQSYLTSNAGRELGRFLQHSALRSKVRPLATGLLKSSSITGRTAPLWVGVAEMTDYYDKANCSSYGTCDLQAQLAAAVLPVTYACSSSITIKAQQMTSGELSSSCNSLRNQDAYFHDVARDSGPVAGDRNDTIEVVVFDSSTDYQTYAGAMYGIDTNNGGMYLEGDPAAAGNQPRFIAYEAEWLRPDFQIWNLNHEYTHYLDGRFDMYGDFGANITTPTIWWIEGFAEYVSYSYRGVPYDAAMTEAGRKTYALSTLFDTTYNNDTTRIYRWGYLATRYMLENHRADVDTVLGHYRSGNWNAARAHLTSTIGTRYDSDWYTWLAGCAAGTCGGNTNPPGNQAPTAAFTSSAQGLKVAFTDESTDPDGTIASRSWNFGDGTTSTAANPGKTYGAAGTYTVKLTVTDDKGATATATRTVTVSSDGGTLTECTGTDTRELGQDCRRSNQSATTGNYAYLYLYVPAGTTQLKITTSGGTGDADLYYSYNGWPSTSSHVQRATGAGNNHTLTVDNPPAGANYISLYAVSGFGGVTVSTSY